VFILIDSRTILDVPKFDPVFKLILNINLLFIRNFLSKFIIFKNLKLNIRYIYITILSA